MQVTAGQTDVTTYFVLRNSADGSATTGATITDIDLQYVRAGAAPSAKVDATELAATDSVHADNNAKEIDGTDAPGLYRIDWPDAAFADGVHQVVLTVKLTDSFTEHLEVEIDPPVDAVKISGDATAADNLELMYDGTGYTEETAPSSRLQVSALAVGSAAISTTASAFVKAGAEPETNTYEVTHEEDGIYHIVEDDGGNTDIYYEFNVGGNGVPVTTTWIGYAQGNNDTYDIYAYNWGGTAWQQIGSVVGTSTATNQVSTFDFTNAHVGAGVNLGLVRWRVLSVDGTAFATDRLLCSYAVVAQSVGYAEGAIWIDTNVSNTNTEAYVDGVADNPVSAWAAALTLSGSLGIKRFRIKGGSSLTLTGDSTGLQLLGDGVFELDLGGQIMTNAYFLRAAVVGTGFGSNVGFKDCLLEDDVSIPPGFQLRCAINAGISHPLTGSGSGKYAFLNCLSLSPGTNTPYVDFSNLGGAVELNVRGWVGGLNYTLDSNCTLFHEVLAGGGVTVAASGANVEICGICRSVTVSVTGSETIQISGVTGPIILNDAGASAATINLYGVSASVTDNTTGSTVNDRTVNQSNIGIEVDTVVDAIQVVTDKLDDTVEDDGGVYRFTANALEQAPTSIGGLTTSTITEDTLDVDGAAFGKIEDGEGIPISGARVVAYADTDIDLTAPLYEGISDGDGGFEVIVVKGATYRMMPIKSGYTFSVKRVTVSL